MAFYIVADRFFLRTTDLSDQFTKNARCRLSFFVCFCVCVCSSFIAPSGAHWNALQSGFIGSSHWRGWKVHGFTARDVFLHLLSSLTRYSIINVLCYSISALCFALPYLPTVNRLALGFIGSLGRNLFLTRPLYWTVIPWSCVPSRGSPSVFVAVCLRTIITILGNMNGKWTKYEQIVNIQKLVKIASRPQQMRLFDGYPFIIITV